MRASLAVALALILAAACRGPEKAGIQRLADGSELAGYQLKSLSGFRDEATLRAEAVFTNGASVLEMKMRFKIGIPTQLETGSYRWAQRNGLIEGPVTARSVTFLGGQSGPPSLGGRFELHSPNGPALYQVRIPAKTLSLR